MPLERALKEDLKLAFKIVSSSNCMGKSKFHVFAENLKKLPKSKKQLQKMHSTL